MRILFLIWNYWPEVEGGSERQARQIATQLANQGHICLIWTALLDSNLPRKETQDFTTIVRFGRWAPWQSKARNSLNRFHKFFQARLNKWFDGIDKYYIAFSSHLDFWLLMPFVYIARRSFMREIRKEFKGIISPDIIHLHEPSWLGGFAVHLAKASKTQVLCQEATYPALPVLGYDVPNRKTIEKHRREAHFIAMAPYLAADLSAKGVPDERIHFLPNGVKIPVQKATSKEWPIVLYVGNFSQGAHWKAFDILFDAWKIIHEQQIGLRLVVLGGGDLLTWKKYVNRHGCASTVDFIGRVTNPEEYYKKAAIFVLPSRVEGMSNALLEAQSWGIPCIVSDIPGNTSIVEDGINGIVVPVNNSQALASSVVELYKDKTLRIQIGLSARYIMNKRYNFENVTKQLVKIYLAIVNK